MNCSIRPGPIPASVRAVTRALPVVLALVFGAFSTSPAQEAELTVAGTVLGPTNQPQPDLRVVLHRVDATGGATVAETVSDADGGFVLNAPASRDTAAVYFIAARYEGELYIAQPFRPGPEAPARHTLQVGIAATSASALLEEAGGTGLPPAGRPASRTSWLLLLVPLLGISAAIVYFLVPRQRIPADRALYMRIAEIDERIDAAPQGQRTAMQAERSRLIEQLRTG